MLHYVQQRAEIPRPHHSRLEQLPKHPLKGANVMILSAQEVFSKPYCLTKSVTVVRGCLICWMKAQADVTALQEGGTSGSTAGEARTSLSELQALRAEQARMKAEYDRMEVSSFSCIMEPWTTLQRPQEAF